MKRKASDPVRHSNYAISRYKLSPWKWARGRRVGVGVACQQFAIFSIKLRNMRVYNYATIFIIFDSPALAQCGAWHLVGPKSHQNRN